MQRTAERLRRFWVVLRAYLANEEPPMETKKTEFAYDWKVAAIHKLRVNIKSLAAEARIIRKEAKRAGPRYRDALTGHRKGRLREEARMAHLALAFMRGRPYKSVEAKSKIPPKEMATKLCKKVEVAVWGNYARQVYDSTFFFDVQKWLET
jgi:hypothetical protein